MKTIKLLLALVIINLAPQAVADEWNSQEGLLKPYEKDAYGPGVNSDATGQPFKWQTQDGKTISPIIDVEPDAYGPGIGMDEYGRPVRPKRWP